jgi:hypothetical protein
VHSHDATTDPAGFGIPADVITDLEYLRHTHFNLTPNEPQGSCGVSPPSALRCANATRRSHGHRSRVYPRSAL